MRPFEIVRIGVWFGLVMGLSEVVLRLIKKFGLGHVVNLGLDSLWMAPAASVAFFAALGLVAAALWAWRPVPRTFQLAIGLFAFVAALGIVLVESQVALYAKELIAAGIAVQAARTLSRNQEWFRRVVRRTLPWAVALVVLLAAGAHGWRWYGYRQAAAALTPNADRAPNVLLVVLDTVRAQNLSVYGYGRPTTPNLDRLAQAAVVFNHAYSTSPWTFPSHASMFTGRWPHELSADWDKPLDARYPTVAEVLRDKGYLTAGFSANIFWCTTAFGMGRGFLHYEDHPVSPSQAVLSTSIGRELISFSLNEDFAFRFRRAIGYSEIPGRKSAAQVNDGFLGWLSGQPDDRPFFAFLNYLDAHQPFLPPAPFDGTFRGNTPRGDPQHWWSRTWSPGEIQAEIDAYDESIAYVDAQIGRLIDDLKRRGKLDNTVVIVTSDHGEHMGEHGYMRHGNTLYPEVLRVPLMILFPDRIKSRVTIADPVSLRDIPATLLALVGQGCDGCLPGHSLARHWDNQDGTPVASTSPVFSEVSKGIRLPGRYPNAKGDLKSLIADGMHYIVNSAGDEELYDLTADPREMKNLAGSTAMTEIRDRFRLRLASIGRN